MTKKAFLEVIQKRLKQIDETNQFGLQYIEGVADLFWQKYALNYLNRYGYDPNFFTKEYNTGAISTDSAGRYYVSLPASIIKIPQTLNSSGSEGVVSMYATTSFSSSFKPIRENDYKSIMNLPVYSTAVEYYFWVKYDKIYFSDNLTAGILSAGVTVNLMVPFSTYTSSENIPIPTEMEKMLWVDIVEYLAGTPKPDLINDNSDD